MAAVEGNASVCRVYPVSRITGERRVEFYMKQKMKRGPGAKMRRGGGNSICARKPQVLLRGQI